MRQADLSDLEAFVAVAEARGFRSAATRRGVSPSALSDAVRRLEERLGLRLLNRTTRSVTPTEAGFALLERLKPALGEVAAALDGLAAPDGEVRGTLRLNVPTVVAELVLPDLIARFMAAHPRVNVEISADNSFIDVLAAGFDAGIRYGERVDRDMIAVPIGPREQRFVTAAAPAYLARHGVPSDPDALAGHRLIRFRFASGLLPPWEFAKQGVSVKVALPAALVSNHVAVQIAAAEAGLGIVHAFEGFLQASVAAGRLVPILEDWSERFPGPMLYYPSRRQVPPALKAFLAFIRIAR